MKKEEKVEGIELKIELKVPKELEEGRYSNYATVGHSPEEFHIFFAQFTSPRELPPDKITYANAVAHIIIAPAVMPKVIKALSDNYEKYEKTYLVEHVK